MSADRNKTPMPIEERAKRYLASYSKHGGGRRAKRFREVEEIEQCKIVEGVVGEMLSPDPRKPGAYRLTCPGITFHTGKNSPRDCFFYAGGVSRASGGASVPSLKCQHQSCGAIIEEMNRSIRSAIGKAGVEYLTDHGSVLNNAAASLIIGFDLPEDRALSLLVAWGKGCTPVHTPLACGKAIAAALESYKKTPDEVGYLLKSARPVAATAASPLSPSVRKRSSFVSTQASKVGVVQSVGRPMYVGARGRVAKQARIMIESFRADRGEDPTILLLGHDQPEVGETMCGLRVERMRSPGISVCGEAADGYDG